MSIHAKKVHFETDCVYPMMGIEKVILLLLYGDILEDQMILIFKLTGTGFVRTLEDFGPFRIFFQILELFPLKF